MKVERAKVTGCRLEDPRAVRQQPPTGDPTKDEQAVASPHGRVAAKLQIRMHVGKGLRRVLKPGPSAPPRLVKWVLAEAVHLAVPDVAAAASRVREARHGRSSRTPAGGHVA